jgi:alpha-amylase/alpha-mannosidase (GH57 family)
MDRYICVHGHFYQPPRENPWLEAVELQDSAYPYHDWNERITAECYAANGVSRILDAKGRITQIVNNYESISFNFGPTLLAWMEGRAPEAYGRILEADRASQERFSGHGSALAQCYNHMIMPLANKRDKYTQVLWGMRDFQRRFGRKPEGMWLPETAVDLRTLDVLAELGVSFTLLAPRQAKRVRQIDRQEWQDVSGGQVDPKTAYMVRLPSGRSIQVLFYDGPVSRAVAFEGLLSDGERFARRLIDAFGQSEEGAQIGHIATDGESYGHHHRYGDMALAYALHTIEREGLARISNYGEYLEKNPPTHEVEIVENSSWSCVHGIERWRSDCGCSTGGHPGWKQAWRGPLRQALDWLRDEMATRYEEEAGKLLKDPWHARNEYIEVVLDRSAERVDSFFGEQGKRALNETEKTRALSLLELQRHAMLMYTSCGWFFDEISGIETVQVLQYAGRVIQLGERLFGMSLEPRFLELLAQARSNVRRFGDGRRVYEMLVKPAVVDLSAVAAHFAVSSLFESYEEEARIYSHGVSLEDYRRFEAGSARLAVGRAEVRSEVTRESGSFDFAVLHWGDQTVNAGVHVYEGGEAYEAMAREIREAFETADFAESIRVLDRHYPESTYSLRTLFRDEQRKVVGQILGSTLSEAETTYRQLYEHHYPLMRLLSDLGNPLPKAFGSAAEVVINADLYRAVSGDAVDVEAARSLLEQAESWGVALDGEGLAHQLRQTLEGLIRAFAEEPEDYQLLHRLTGVLELPLPFEVNLWGVQNTYYELLHGMLPGKRQEAEGGSEEAQRWVEAFLALGERLSVATG